MVDFRSQIYLDNDDRSHGRQWSLVWTYKICYGGGGSLLGDIFVGAEKSLISLFSNIPVEGDKIPPANGKFTVVVIDTAFLSASTMQK